MEKKSQKKSEIWKLYNVNGSTLERKNRSCPKCGEGTFLAQHQDRMTCGHCGYTEFIKKEKNK